MPSLTVAEAFAVCEARTRAHAENFPVGMLVPRDKRPYVYALYAFMRDPQAPAQGKAVAIGALLYFILPIDIIPDVIPVLGYVDDAAVIATAVSFLNTQLAAYRRRNRKAKAQRRAA